jgi:hypothetical protein
VFSYYLKDDIKKLKEKRQDAEKAKYEKKQKVYYPSIDTLRLEDNQPDPYLLFTVKDQSGNVVRHLKTTPKKGLKRLVWDFRASTPAPVNNRYTPAPDQLFGGAEEGPLVAPGQYSVTLSKYEDGTLTELAGPVTFTCKLLESGSLPTNMNANAAFYSKVADLRKAVTAANDLLNTMGTRVRNINLAIQDMPAPAKSALEKAHALQKDLLQMNVLLFGDQTLGRREFETIPTINDRVSGIEGAVWSSTDQIPKMYVESYAVAAKQFTQLLTDLKKAHTAIEAVEKELEMNNAPYTPGRWPEWKEN